jgi:hypothetical protein
VTAPLGWWWPLLTGVAIVVALLASAVPTVATVAATLAVVGGALTVVDAVARRRERAAVPILAPRSGPGGAREAFRGGETGREDIMLALDLLERKVVTPTLRARTAPELSAVAGRTPEEFRRYVAQRLDELERAS